MLELIIDDASISTNGDSDSVESAHGVQTNKGHFINAWMANGSGFCTGQDSKEDKEFQRSENYSAANIQEVS